MFEHLLKSSHPDDSNKLSNIGFSEEIRKVESIEVMFTHFIWCIVNFTVGIRIERRGRRVTRLIRYLLNEFKLFDTRLYFNQSLRQCFECKTEVKESVHMRKIWLSGDTVKPI